MKITRDQLSPLTVRHIERGSITIGNETFRNNLVLTADREIEEWRPDAVAELREDDFAAILATNPEIIVLGTGWSPAIPPRELIFAMARRGVGFEAMATPAACRTFNILVNEGRRVAAILMIDG